MDAEIKLVNSDDDLRQVRDLFGEYGELLRLRHGQKCLGGFAAEVAGLPGEYGPPAGCVLLARREGEVLGCVALRRLGEDACEIKRLYVRPSARGAGVGRLLTQAALDKAKRLGFRVARLDTLPSMTEAIALYRSLGFTATAAYGRHPEGAVCFERTLG